MLTGRSQVILRLADDRTLTRVTRIRDRWRFEHPAPTKVSRRSRIVASGRGDGAAMQLHWRRDTPGDPPREAQRAPEEQSPCAPDTTVGNARFRLADELSPFLPKERRGVLFTAPFAKAATLKNAIEALGVPHTEVGAVTVNGEPATLARIVREADSIDVLSWRHGPRAALDPDAGFVADAHLGGLARFLRMLGFDTVQQDGIADSEIRRLAREERRVVLSRDRELMKCREIHAGGYVRSVHPEEQLREVAERFALAAHARPFTLCLYCNVRLAPVDKAAVRGRLPERVAQLHERFVHCRGCDRVYWPGSHYERMRAVLGDLLGGTAGADAGPAPPR
jgi:uncharacterized protein with PIN domain